MKKIILSVFIISLAVSVTAQTRWFEVSKTSYVPFVGEAGGFESLFVNPAGMAGQTNIFTWDIEAGAKAKKSTIEAIQLMMESSDTLNSPPDVNEDMTPEEAEEIVDLLVDNLDQESTDLLTDGTVLDGMSPEEIQEYFEEGGEIDVDDAILLGDNAAEHQEEIIDNAMSNIKASVEFTTKVGTLIKGFGLGGYANIYSVLSAAEMGFETLVVESGIKAGFGFNLSEKLALGVSADFAFLGDVTATGGVSIEDIGDIMSRTMYYGYAWGIDVGAAYHILPSLTVGAVMTDLIGTYVYNGTTTLEELMNGGAKNKIESTYEFDLDLDFGVTWAPRIGSGKIFNASFSADYYDLFGLFREETRPEDFQGFLNHMRFGAEFELLSFINLRAHYYREYFALGAGVDLLFLEVFGEFQFKQSFDDIGGALLVKLHF